MHAIHAEQATVVPSKPMPPPSYVAVAAKAIATSQAVVMFCC